MEMVAMETLVENTAVKNGALDPASLKEASLPKAGDAPVKTPKPDTKPVPAPHEPQRRPQRFTPPAPDFDPRPEPDPGKEDYETCQG
ncbi:MAG: hypothetical protein D6719_01495 [Candidatus Dadabacteria bacterium]|nr:MAG: hypothetical protein D6719_01495 [Candidatus Dadabacteria bacterium]